MKYGIMSMCRIWTWTFVVMAYLAGGSLYAAPAEEPPPPPPEEHEAEHPGDAPAPEDPSEGDLSVTNGTPTNLVSAAVDRSGEPISMPGSPGPTGVAPGQTASVAPAVSGVSGQIPAAAGSDPTRRDQDSRSSDRRGRSDEGRGRFEASRATTGETTAGGPAPEGFAAFRLIMERNIFDPNRSPRQSASPRETPRPRPRTVESFRLVGVMSYEKGRFAFFDGTSADYRKALKHADEIAGFRVAAIGDGSVRLAKGDEQVELRVGSQMRREEAGSWQAAAGGPEEMATATSVSPSATAASPNPAGAAGAGEPDNEVLKRLMQRREKE